MIIPSPPNQFLQIRKLHFILCAMVALSIIVFYFVLYDPNKVVDQKDSFGLILEVIVPLFSVISVFLGNFMFKKSIKETNEKSELEDKLSIYKKASLVKWSNVLGSVFLAIVAYYLTSRNNFILYALMLGVFLIYLRPLKSRIIEELKLSDDHIKVLNKE